jgi:hypothetical protein
VARAKAMTNSTSIRQAVVDFLYSDKHTTIGRV